MDVAVKGAKAFLAVAVDVVCQLIAGLLHCFEEGPKERVIAGAGFQAQRAFPAVIEVAAP